MSLSNHSFVVRSYTDTPQRGYPYAMPVQAANYQVQFHPQSQGDLARTVHTASTPRMQTDIANLNRSVQLQQQARANTGLARAVHMEALQQELAQAVLQKKAAEARAEAAELSLQQKVITGEATADKGAVLQHAENAHELAREALVMAKDTMDKVATVDQQRVSQKVSQAQSLASAQHNGEIGKMAEADLDLHFDCVIIGGGPVGVAAAQKAACLGHHALIIDKPKLPPLESGLDVTFGGPTGLFSKALRDIGKHVDVRSLRSLGLDDAVIWHQIRNDCVKLATMNAEHQVRSLKNFKIGYLQAYATIASPDCVVAQVADGSFYFIKTDHILVATGSRPQRPKEIPFDDTRIFDADTINTLTFLPKSVAILGSGIIAIEYAKIFRKFGLDVYVLVRSSTVSSLERVGLDHDVAAKLIEAMLDDNIHIYEGTTIAAWEVPQARESPIVMKLNSKSSGVPKELECDIFLAATGRTPCVSGFGLDKLGVKIAEKGGHIVVDDEFQSSVPGVYAAGDVIGPPALASTGVFQAQAAVLEMFHEGHMNKFNSFPIGMWTTPECGYFGLTKAAAEKKGMEVEEGMVHYDACLRGRVFAPLGLLKMVFRKRDGVIVGVHILGQDACELVHYGMDLVNNEVSIFKVMTTCFTAVTFHELFKEAALDGNSKLEFGLEWHKILHEFGMHLDDHHEHISPERVKAEFQALDADGSGHLDASALQAVFENLGLKVSRAVISNVIRLADDDGNGLIEWEEFEKVLIIMDDIRDVGHYGKKDEEETSKKPPKPEAEVSSSVSAKDKMSDTQPKEHGDIVNGVNDRQVGA